MPVIKKVCESAPKWGTLSKLYMRRSVANWERYQDAWHLVARKLGLPVNG
jgi:hypothetical protein